MIDNCSSGEEKENCKRKIADKNDGLDNLQPF